MTNLERLVLQHGGTITGIRREALASARLDGETQVVGRYAFTIDGYLPPSLNALMHCHWRKKHALKKECTEMVAVYGSMVPKAKGKRRVTITLVRSGRRRERDQDNAAQKSVLDALVGCGLLVDDSPSFVTCEVVQIKGTTTETRIELEDMP